MEGRSDRRCGLLAAHISPIRVFGVEYAQVMTESGRAVANRTYDYQVNLAMCTQTHR